METTDHMKVFLQVPREALRPFVKRFLVVEFPAAHHDAHLPDTGLVAAFLLQGDCRLNGGTRAPVAAVTGLWDSERTHDHGPGNTVVLAQFTPTGAAAFLREPLDEFFNATVACDDVVSRPLELRRVHEQMAEAPNHGRRVRLLEDFLLERIGHARPDPLICAAVAWIERAHPDARIEALVRYIGLSQSALERRFRRQVGSSPRKFASIIRLQKVLRLRAEGNDFTSITHAAGYFDQSHFIKDFRRFTGRAPEAYFRRTAAN